MTVQQTPNPTNPTQVSTMQQYPTTSTGLAGAPPQVGYDPTNLTPAQQAIFGQIRNVPTTGTQGYGSNPNTGAMGTPTVGTLTAPQMTLANLIGNQTPATGYLDRGLGGSPVATPPIMGNTQTIRPAPNRSMPTMSNRSPLVV